jgi:lipopolysaccharide/colanic/teichoic acid biosynthesis glycosyltransferase
MTSMGSSAGESRMTPDGVEPAETTAGRDRLPVAENGGCGWEGNGHVSDDAHDRPGPRRDPTRRARRLLTARNAAALLGARGSLASTGAAVMVVLALTFVGVLGPWVGGSLATLAIVAWVAQLRRSNVGRRPPARTLVIGSPASLNTLNDELVFYGIQRYALVGCLSLGTCERQAHDMTLRTPAEVRSVVLQHKVDIVLMASEVSRMAVFDAMAEACDDLDVRLCDLSEFYEDTFEYTPIAEINSAWFQAILHPGYRPASLRLKRAFDVAFALVMSVALLPALAALAWIIRRDGGHALFRQVRVGEGGRPFVLYKLRTMSPQPAGEASWSTAEDPRVTAIGRHLRRLHLDELPQLWNILRGDMSVVGPRPEQPAIVRRLEREFRFYHRRHALRPGLAGWAQARCGYAGSDGGAAWKLSHDLYYLKRRSLRFDLRIIVESMWQVGAGNQFEEPRLTSVVVQRIGESPSPAPVADERTALELGTWASG